MSAADHLDEAVRARTSGRFSHARELCERAIAEDPRSVSVRERAAEILQRIGDLESAYRALSHPDAPRLALRAADLLLQLGRPRDVRAALSPLALGPGTDAQRLVLGADRLRAAGEFAEAEGAYREALTRSPPPAAAHAGLAELALWRGDARSARDHASAGLNREPGDLRSLRARAAADLLLGAPAAAPLAELERCAAAQPRDGETRLWLARARAAAGDPLAALREILHAKHFASAALLPVCDLELVALGRRHFGAHLSLEELSALARGAKIAASPPRTAAAPPPHDLARDSDERATLTARGYEALVRAKSAAEELDLLRGNRSATPTFVDPHSGELVLLELRESVRERAKSLQWSIRYRDPDVVLRGFDELERAHPRSHHPHAYRGELLLWLGRYAEAREALQRGLALSPHARWIHIGLGAAELFEGRLVSSLDWFRRSTEVAPDLLGPVMRAYRGEALRKSGDLGRAAEDLAHCCERTPTRIGAHANLWLVEDARGNAAARDAAWSQLARRAPALVADAAAEAPDGSPRAHVEQMLAMMRGNRSSTCVTYFARAVPASRDLPGAQVELRVVPTVAD